jgi:polysaccharide deacetylase family protein (PEP-CTERM system associated)
MKILTFDVEDWFHILDNMETKGVDQWKNFPSRIDAGVERLLDFCDQSNIKATFFILGWIAESAPEIVAEISRRGHEVGCHSYTHQLVYQQSPENFQYDLLKALDLIEKAAGERPNSYRAPGFSITQSCIWAFDILAENGITVDCSVFPASRAHGGMPGFSIAEPFILRTSSGHILKSFPMTYYKLLELKLPFSGGGYFRLLPYALLNQLFKKSGYVMTYFHPRDFDLDQPEVPGLSSIRRFKSYVGIRTALNKLEKIAFTNNFISVHEAINLIDWDHAPEIKVADLIG